MSSALGPSAESLAVSPVIHFPKEAEAGKTYLFTIDLSPQQSFAAWPYADSEEVIVYCQINAAPIFSAEPLGEPAVVIHRFGGTYGPARFLITAASEPQEGVIRITLISGRGVPLTTYETPTINVRAQVEVKQPLGLRVPRSETAAPRQVAQEPFVAEVTSPPVTTESPDTPARIFLSSTFEDLREYREAVYSALRASRHDVIGMEDYLSSPTTPLEKFYADVDYSDLYIGIFAWRYGYVSADEEAQGRSITELEYRRAVASQKPCFIFMVDEDTVWRPSWIDSGTSRKKLIDLREELKSTHIVNYFKDPDDLAQKVLAAVNKWLAEKDTKPDPGFIRSDSGTLKVASEPNVEITDVTTSQHAAPDQPTHDNGSAPGLSPDMISISRLPVTSREFIGRESELAMLDEAWDDIGTIHGVSLVGWGGAGKSALVNEWLARMAQNDFRGAERVYGWSFYSQGTSERTASADLFIDQALRWFGDPDSTLGTPWDKGQRLARLISNYRTLLVLDGLEPLQYPPGPDEGQLKDPALQALLRQLAASSQGLCVMTSRAALTDLDSFVNRTIIPIDLSHLSPKEGAEMLRARGVNGSQEELEKASQEFGGHPLSLALLGHYLADAFGGDITRRGNISNLEDEKRYGIHAQSVLAAYELWFRGRPELAVLRLLSLFDGTATEAELDALRSPPLISGVTDTLTNQSPQQWQSALSALRRFDLLTSPTPDDPRTVTTHPLVREYFGRKLRSTNPDAWRECHNRLYEHLSRTAKELPETLEELRPLYAAIYHGCQAGRHQEVLDDVYRGRINRGNEFYSISALGAFQTDLAALANFFAQPWDRVVEGLSESSRLFVLNAASFDLRALGRPLEAAQPLNASLKISIAQQNWDNASGASERLTSLYLNIGDIASAIRCAEEATVFGARAGNTTRMLLQKVNYGRALQQAGRTKEAESSFRQAERMSGPSQLPSSLTFFYNTLLLDKGRYLEVHERAQLALRMGPRQQSLLDEAFACISLGQALIGTSRDSHKKSLVEEAAGYLFRAVEGLRKAGQEELLPYGLLARAELHRLTHDFISAPADLNETMSIARKGSMKLHEADCHLELARLLLAMRDFQGARESALRARQIIKEVGYHRRDKALRELEKEVSVKLNEPAPRTSRDSVFIVFSHRDQKWVDRLVDFLRPVIGDNEILLWGDTAIEPGTKWKQQMATQLASTKVVVLMVSAHLLASRFIADREGFSLLEAAEKDELKLFWVAVGPSKYRQTPLARFQAINDPSKPLNKLSRSKRDIELVQIAETVEAALRS